MQKVCMHVGGDEADLFYKHMHDTECMVYLRCALPNTCLCTASSSCQTRYSWPAAPASSSPWLYTPLAYHKHTHTHCHFPKILSFCYSHSASACVFPSHHSCSSGEGMRPAVPFFVFSSLPCHQLWSSLEMIWMMSPTRKRMPASLQGISSSLEGSYSN